MNQRAVRVFLCKSGTHGRHTNTHKRTYTHVRTHWWHTSQREHGLSGYLSCVQTQLIEYTPEEVGTSHLSITLIFFRFWIFLTILNIFCNLSLSLSFPTLAIPAQVLPSYANGFKDGKATVCNALTYITCTHIRHDTIPPQEKLWARTSRETLENQDTIWHLWSLNDFLLGVGLCPTGKSQKTGRENYIRENVYAAHLAPSLFAPQMSDYSSTLNLWERGGWWRGRFFPSLAFGRGGCWHRLTSLSQCELLIWQYWRHLGRTPQNVEPPPLKSTGYAGDGG